MQTMTRMTSSMFEGAEVKGGSVTLDPKGDVTMLTLSDDFQVPGAPAPHWRVVDAMGNAYLLQRLVVAGGKYHQSIVLPSYVKSVAKVQIWCAFAEVMLGEAEFMPKMA
jgi:hypothetical protein